MKVEFGDFNITDCICNEKFIKEYLNKALAAGDLEEFKQALLSSLKAKI
ncbi:hypothetical protein [Campylobacter geochelonis]|uniref:Addiction module antidote protein n=1 Tax=Campylobacter geochelonis TaxID=1780362 RepID=A0A128ECS2_9BACT|nr:hypothetical protein [Campylobacter geochelonis]CZE46162.1 addiction module antidote protein [Campylobacter geochelonis]CZE46471.1 addiction module antidote protein [Campylobacter geochelonis]CZE50460.1 addiction module antidote protein [Campylobacter geochelonis]